MDSYVLKSLKLLLLFSMVNTVYSIGANWGTQGRHPMHPTTVVRLLRDNGIQKVKLFDAEARVLNALSGSGIEVMVGIPNDMLYTLANSVDAAERWVERNVSGYVSSNSVDIRNVFDANYDTLLWALQRNGFGNLTVIVGEIGWPTDGDRNANVASAQRFNQGFMSHVNRGTPLRPGPVDAYLFSLIDEDAKSIQPGNFERHWGMFNYDGTPKYNLSLSSNSRGLVPATNVHYYPRRWCVLSNPALLQDANLAPSVSYACDRADCTSLGFGTSCLGLDAAGNVSYAFNSYYQESEQLESACRFSNLSVITTTDPSVGSCRFKVMIQTGDQGSGGCLLESVNMVQLPLFLLSFFMIVKA